MIILGVLGVPPFKETPIWEYILPLKPPERLKEELALLARAQAIIFSSLHLEELAAP